MRRSRAGSGFLGGRGELPGGGFGSGYKTGRWRQGGGFGRWEKAKDGGEGGGSGLGWDSGGRLDFLRGWTWSLRGVAARMRGVPSLLLLLRSVLADLVQLQFFRALVPAGAGPRLPRPAPDHQTRQSLRNVVFGSDGVVFEGEGAGGGGEPGARRRGVGLALFWRQHLLDHAPNHLRHFSACEALVGAVGAWKVAVSRAFVHRATSLPVASRSQVWLGAPNKPRPLGWRLWTFESLWNFDRRPDFRRRRTPNPDRRLRGECWKGTFSPE